MTRAEQESTARINRDELLGLLDTMHPTEQQPITARVRISDVQAEAARDLPVRLAEPSDAEVTKIVDVSKILEALKAAEEAKEGRIARLVEELKAIEDAKPVAGPNVVEVPMAARVASLLVELKAIAEAKPVAVPMATRVARLLEELKAIKDAQPAAAPMAEPKPVEARIASRVARLLEELKAIEEAKPLEAPMAKAKPVEVPIVVANVIESNELAEQVADARLVAESPNIVDARPRRESQRLFNDVDWDDILGAAMSAMVSPARLKPIEPAAATAPAPARAKRASKAPFSHIAALLPPTVPAARVRAKTNNDAALPRAEQKAVQVIADVRAKLESAAQTPTQWDAQHDRPSFPTLSPQVAAELSGEEISMLPMEIRLMLPEVSFPRIAMTPAPSDLTIAIHSTPCKELGHSIRISDGVEAAPAASTAWRVLALVGYFIAACFAGLGAVYCLA